LFCSLAFVLPAAPAGAQATATATATGTPGVFQLAGQGFGGDEVVAVWLTGPSQQVVAMGYQEADGDGMVSFQMLMRRHFQPGRWAITMHGLDGGVQAITSFDLPFRGPDVTVNVSQASGPIGTTFAFSSTGFQANEAVSYWLTGPDGRAVEGDIVSANADGRVDFSITPAADTATGRWWVSAYGEESDRLGVVSFTLGEATG
jgi:hypothetical protein